MAKLSFTPNLARLVAVPAGSWPGETVRAVLDAAFAEAEPARSYVLDEHGRLRKHVVVFVDGEMVEDRDALTDVVDPDGEVFVMQALSGG